MWAPTSLIIRLVSVGCRDTFFFFSFTAIALRCTALICSVLSSTWEADLAVKANSPKDAVWSETPSSLASLFPVEQYGFTGSQIVFTAPALFPCCLILVMRSLTVYRYWRWLPALINFRGSSWCLRAKRNQSRCKEPRVYRSRRFSLPHSFPCGALKPSLISIQTALLIASFVKKEQSGPFSLLLYHRRFSQGSVGRCATEISITILSSSMQQPAWYFKSIVWFKTHFSVRSE